MKRKVREDFDTTAEYSVDVSESSVKEKKEVQQGFFDAGIVWRFRGAEYQFLDASQYSNKYSSGGIAESLLYGGMTKGCNMTAKEFLNLVYGDDMEDNNKHIHAELMAQYAEDAKTSKTPWELWEYLDKDDGWCAFRGSPGWYETTEYRRAPKTHMVHGVEIPDLRVLPEYGTYYYLADPTEREFTYRYLFNGDTQDSLWSERGLCYQPTEEGKQAATLHAKAMLGMLGMLGMLESTQD